MTLDPANAASAQPPDDAPIRSAEDPYLARVDLYRDDPGHGWVTFAGVLLLLAGTLSLIFGLAAVGNSRFVAGHPRYILGNAHVWGWIGVIIGVVQVAVGLGVFAKNQLSRWVGVIVLALSAPAELLTMPSYPFWSLSIFTLCILAMYGLIAHGEKISPLDL